jgi:hypothetical protein
VVGCLFVGMSSTSLALEDRANDPLNACADGNERGVKTTAGTRVTVELILGKLSAGETIEQILDAHPRLTREAIQAALAFAAKALR